MSGAMTNTITNKMIKLFETDKVDAFNAHLDTCQQCRENPFNLCPAGVSLLVNASKVSGVMGDQA